MKNITVSVDDETYRRARIRAAEKDTSVSALVKQFLNDIAKDETQNERLKREEKALRAGIRNFRADGNISRDKLHRREH
jgi:plasmid stability protein